MQTLQLTITLPEAVVGALRDHKGCRLVPKTLSFRRQSVRIEQVAWIFNLPGVSSPGTANKDLESNWAFLLGGWAAPFLWGKLCGPYVLGTYICTYVHIYIYIHMYKPLQGTQSPLVQFIFIVLSKIVFPPTNSWKDSSCQGVAI